MRPVIPIQVTIAKATIPAYGATGTKAVVWLVEVARVALVLELLVREG